MVRIIKYYYFAAAYQQYLHNSQYYYGAIISMKKSARGMWINPGVVFTFTRQRWGSITFRSYLALLAWGSNILNIPQLSTSYPCNNFILRAESKSCFIEKHLISEYFFFFFSYYIQHCFICRPSDSTVPTDAGIEPRTVATGALAVRRSNH